MSILPPERTAAMQAIAERGFTPDRESFAARIVAATKASEEAKAIASDHLKAFERQKQHGYEELSKGNLGLAASFLRVADLSWKAAINSLPH